ncbi:MAG TPA: DUF4160 domain-containing protein [Acetobacteraceae bacterium]
MSTVLQLEGFRFFFYSREYLEPPHIHVEQGDRTAKFWLNPVRFATSRRFRPYELGELQEMVVVSRQTFPEVWNAHFGDES